jgi:hypothetical protein
MDKRAREHILFHEESIDDLTLKEFIAYLESLPLHEFKQCFFMCEECGHGELPIRDICGKCCS